MTPAVTEEALGRFIEEAQKRLSGMVEPSPVDERCDTQPAGLRAHKDGTIIYRHREVGRVQQIPGGFECQHGDRTFRLASRASILDIVKRLEEESRGKPSKPDTR